VRVRRTRNPRCTTLVVCGEAVKIRIKLLEHKNCKVMAKLLKLRLPVALLALALAPLAAPLLAPNHPLTALLIRNFFARLCHQDPARSFMVEGSPVAVCVRCLGIYCGAALAGLLRLGRASASRLLAVALLLNLLDVAAGTLHWHGNLPLLRLLLGLLLGVGAGAVLLWPQGRFASRLSTGA
jgi:uncharacterized membrane protein